VHQNLYAINMEGSTDTRANPHKGWRASPLPVNTSDAEGGQGGRKCSARGSINSPVLYIEKFQGSLAVEVTGLATTLTSTNTTKLSGVERELSEQVGTASTIITRHED